MIFLPADANRPVLGPARENVPDHGETGELKLKFTEAVGQHHVTWVGDDLIQVFDNGASASRVLEIRVSTGEIEWTYEGRPVAIRVTLPMSFGFEG